MPKEKLVNTSVHSENALRLKTLLLDYHEHRELRAVHPLRERIRELSEWQAERLKRTHQDLYHHPKYHEGLDFLLRDLYAPKDFSQRDDDIERIFPVMVKLLPDSVLYTVANLVELNLLTQQLDLALAEQLFTRMNITQITEPAYAEAYYLCDNKALRLHQIQLIANIGNDLEQYVHSRFLAFTLRMTAGPAELAGLGELHNFLTRGFHAFRAMEQVEQLLEIIVSRETRILDRIYERAPAPFDLQAPDPVPVPAQA